MGNRYARENNKVSQEMRDARNPGKFASDTTFRDSYPQHPVQPKMLQLQNPNYLRTLHPKIPERSASQPHISGLVGNPNDWSPRTLRMISICRNPGVRPNTETMR